MKVLLDLTIVPIGVGTSLSRYVAACEEILDRPGLKTQLHANGTNVEGEWAEVFDAIRACHEKIHEMGAPRIHTNIKLGTRSDRDQSLADKVASVQARLEEEPS